MADIVAALLPFVIIGGLGYGIAQLILRKRPKPRSRYWKPPE